MGKRIPQLKSRLQRLAQKEFDEQQKILNAPAESSAASPDKGNKKKKGKKINRK